MMYTSIWLVDSTSVDPRAAKSQTYLLTQWENQAVAEKGSEIYIVTGGLAIPHMLADILY